GPDLDPFDLESRTLFERRVRAPWTRDGAMQLVRFVTTRLQLSNHLFDALQMIAMRDEHRVGRVDDDEILDADGSNDAIAGMNVSATGCDRNAFAVTAVAVNISLGQCRDGLPRSDVAPIERPAHDGHFARCRRGLHHRVVDRNV